MKFSNIHTDRSPLTPQDIAQGQSFQQLLKQATPKAWYQTGWFYASTALAVVAGAVVLSLTVFSGNEPTTPNTETASAPVTHADTTAAAPSLPMLRTSAIQPPLHVDVPAETIQVNADRGGTFTVGHSTITVPAGCFVDANGNPITGEVDLDYREFRNKADLFLSGIPMEYDSAGTAYTFESAGMFELRGQQNGQEVFIAPGSDLTVEMEQLQASTEFSQYVLDEETGAWEFLQPATLDTRAAVDTTSVLQGDDVGIAVENVFSLPGAPMLENWTLTVPGEVGTFKYDNDGIGHFRSTYFGDVQEYISPCLPEDRRVYMMAAGRTFLTSNRPIADLGVTFTDLERAWISSQDCKVSNRLLHEEESLLNIHVEVGQGTGAVVNAQVVHSAQMPLKEPRRHAGCDHVYTQTLSGMTHKLGEQVLPVVKLVENTLVPDGKVQPRPRKLAELSSSLYQIELAFDAEAYPELAAFNEVLFEVPVKDGPAARRASEKAWNSVNIERAIKPNHYTLTFRNQTSSYSVETYPVVPAGAKRDADQSFDSLLQAYESTKASRRKRVVQKASEAVLDAMPTEELTVNNSYQVEAALTAVFTVNRFGVYNSDCPRNLPKGAVAQRRFEDTFGDKLAPDASNTVFLADAQRNAVFRLYNNVQVQFNPNAASVMWFINRDSQLAVAQLDALVEASNQRRPIVCETFDLKDLDYEAINRLLFEVLEGRGTLAMH